MVRKIITQNHSEDTSYTKDESVRADLRNEQEEMVNLAGVKKQLESDIAKHRSTMQSGFDKIEADHKKKLSGIISSIDQNKETREKFESEIRILSEAETSLKKTNKSLTDDNETKSTVLTELTVSIEKSEQKKSELESDIKKLGDEVTKLTNDKKIVLESIISLTANESTLKESVKTENESLVKITESIKSISDKIVIEKDNLKSITDSILTKKSEEQILKSSIEFLTNQENKLKDKNQKTDEEITEKMVPLSTLETRVDEKIRIFKEYKAKFTVDELAKIKVSTDL